MRVLLIDDDINLCKVLAYQLEKNKFNVTMANKGEDGLKLFNKNEFDVIITDIQMPDISGIDVLQRIRRKNRDIIIIIITAYGSVENALEACRLGANDYITKPFSQEQFLFVIEKAVRFKKLEQENLSLKEEVSEKYKIDNIIASSAHMQDIIRTSLKVAQSNANILILGESGTGKELIAKTIHYNSPRKDKPLVIINCPSIPPNLLESEMFGHVKGAFTGAIKDQKGKFQEADGGTIFLDEIGDLPGELQAKLLRFLQEHEFQRIGESNTIKVDVRIIAATNKDLEQQVRENKFRDDLYYRLSVIPIQIKPLRERKEDIPYLIDFFLDRYPVNNERAVISNEVMNVLKNYYWPGNARELENIIERITTLASSSEIRLKDIPQYLLEKDTLSPEFSINIPEEGIGLEEIERKVIQQLLIRTKGNRSKTAKLLKVPRHILLYRMKKFGLT